MQKKSPENNIKSPKLYKESQKFYRRTAYAVAGILASFGGLLGSAVLEKATKNHIFEIAGDISAISGLALFGFLAYSTASYTLRNFERTRRINEEFNVKNNKK